MSDTITRYHMTITFVEPVPADHQQAAVHQAASMAADLHIQLLLAADPNLQQILAAQHLTLQVGVSQLPTAARLHAPLEMDQFAGDHKYHAFRNVGGPVRHPLQIVRHKEQAQCRLHVGWLAQVHQ